MNGGIMISTQTQKNERIIQCTEIKSRIDGSLPCAGGAAAASVCLRRECVGARAAYTHAYCHVGKGCVCTRVCGDKKKKKKERKVMMRALHSLLLGVF